MYRTCIYCQRSLGGNEIVEEFPIGRRLAFDQERGRLWVICQRCRRWNLSPLDERWEAIEECERRYRDTPTRFSTDNIGLACLPEGLQLVRIGRPQRREFAAWRYGKQFMQRRIKNVVITAARIAGTAAMALAGVYAFTLVSEQRDRIVARVKSKDGRRLYIPLKDARSIKLSREPDGESGWVLTVPYRNNQRDWGIFGQWGKGKRQIERMEGEQAIRAAGFILPRVNSFGGSGSQVREAVRLIEDARSPERLFALSAAENGADRFRSFVHGDATKVAKMHATVRLALEMAAHEDSERRAFEGELALLEEAWREAEEIAGIADRLLIPESVENWIERQKQKFSNPRAARNTAERDV
ncbi:MAG TPA: hypothetical protein VLC48_08335 [Gemmatimonadota bacterium]|nr:hypothetical protein [Gemmatimonadota bacterium]